MTKDIKKRWSNNGSQYKLCNLFWKAIQKYKWDGFEHIVLIDNITKEMACIIEKELIKKYKTQDKKFGYNLADGGTVQKYNCISYVDNTIYDREFVRGLAN